MDKVGAILTGIGALIVGVGVLVVMLRTGSLIDSISESLSVSRNAESE